MPKQVELNNFVFRQTAQSRFSHFEPASGNPADTFTELEALVASRFAQANWFESEEDLAAAGGVGIARLKDKGKVVKLFLAPADCRGFFSGVVRADEKTIFKTVFAARERAVDGERPFIHSVAVNGKKSAAVVVEVVLYHIDELSLKERTYKPEGTDIEVVQEGKWQVVSVNARDTFDPEPPTPQAMARNMAAHFALPEGVGGTARLYTAEEYMRAILYWSERTMAADC